MGVPLTDLEAVRAATRTSGRDPEAILVNALNTWFASVMGAETFHADVHAGKVLHVGGGGVVEGVCVLAAQPCILVNALNTWFAWVMGAETFHADVHVGASRHGRRG